MSMSTGLMLKKRDDESVETGINNIFISSENCVNILDWAHSILRIKDILKESPDVCFPLTCNYGDFEVIVNKSTDKIEDILSQIRIGV